MSDKVWAALAARELTRRKTQQVADSLLEFLRNWARTGEPVNIDLSVVGADAEIPAGSLCRFLSHPAECNALARVSSAPGELLALLMAYEKHAVGTG